MSLASAGGGAGWSVGGAAGGAAGGAGGCAAGSFAFDFAFGVLAGVLLPAGFVAGGCVLSASWPRAVEPHNNAVKAATHKVERMIMVTKIPPRATEMSVSTTQFALPRGIGRTQILVQVYGTSGGTLSPQAEPSKGSMQQTITSP
ncbi:MAG: hypothetical protein EBR10_01140 [Planctomycetes bacterium]|nr:hypothetical protein [Planctomycetota bacterium]